MSSFKRVSHTGGPLGDEAPNVEIACARLTCAPCSGGCCSASVLDLRLESGACSEREETTQNLSTGLECLRFHALMRSALDGLLSDKPGKEAASRLLVRFAEDHASEEGKICMETSKLLLGTVL